jgi:hypothetical protein
MKKIIELIKKLLGNGTTAEKAVALNELQVEVKQDVEAIQEVVKEVKAKKAKAPKTSAEPKAPKAKKTVKK